MTLRAHGRVPGRQHERRLAGSGVRTRGALCPAVAGALPRATFARFTSIEGRRAMIEVPLISVIDRGSMERVVLSIEERPGAPAEEVMGVADAGGLLAQLTLARSVARTFLTSPYVRAAARDTLERGTLVARFEGHGSIHGRGLGLALLAGCLSLGLDAPLRGGRVFYASLAEPVARRRMPGGGTTLRPVTALEQALAAEDAGAKTKLFICAEKPQPLPGAAPAPSPGDGDACLLPPVLSMAALTAMALDTKVLLDRAASADDGAGFCLLLLWSCGEVENGASFPEGIGAALAQLKARRRLTTDSAITELVGDALSDPYGEVAADGSLKRGIDAASEAKLQQELADASISPDARSPLIPASCVPSGETSASQSNLREWLTDEAPDTLQRLWLGLNVLGVCRGGAASWYTRRWGPAAVMCAVAGTALMGLLAWYGLAALTGCDFEWGLWLLGALVGFVTLRASRGPDRNMAAVAAGCTAVVVLVGSYLAVSNSQEMTLRREADRNYSRMMSLAPVVSAAETENEIRQAVARINCPSDEDTPDPDAVGEEEIGSFKTDVQPKYQGVLDGNPTRGQFIDAYIASPWQAKMDLLFEHSMNLWTLLLTAAGAFLAFVIASGALGRK